VKTIIGDLWDQNGWKVIPTNLSVNKDGLAVLGRGVALQAARHVRHLREEYGRFLQEHDQPRLYVFPPLSLILLSVKRRWSDQADLRFIARGCRALADTSPQECPRVSLPLLGCGFGELREQDVRPLLEKWLDDRFTLVLRDEATTRRYASSLTPGTRVDRSIVHNKL